MNDFDEQSTTVPRRCPLAAASLYISAVGSGALKACRVEEVDDDRVDLQPLIRIGHAYLEEMAESGEFRSAAQGLLDDVI